MQGADRERSKMLATSEVNTVHSDTSFMLAMHLWCCMHACS